MFRISGVVVFSQVSNVPDLWDGRFLGYLGFQCFGSFRKRIVANIIEKQLLVQRVSSYGIMRIMHGVSDERIYLPIRQQEKMLLAKSL